MIILSTTTHQGQTRASIILSKPATFYSTAKTPESSSARVRILIMRRTQKRRPLDFNLLGCRLPQPNYLHVPRCRSHVLTAPVELPHGQCVLPITWHWYFKYAPNIPSADKRVLEPILFFPLLASLSPITV